MNELEKFAAYPLTAELTKRVVNYLGFFRLFISLALAFFLSVRCVDSSENFQNPALANTALISYFVLAVYLFIEIPTKKRIYSSCPDFFVCRCPFSFIVADNFRGLESGLGVLLVFVSATAAIILPLRKACFLPRLPPWQ